MLRDDRSTALYVTIVTLMAAVFAADVFTPLGVAVWILYVVPVGATLIGRSESAAIWVATFSTALMLLTFVTDEVTETPRDVAGINRLCGVIVLWVLAVMARSIVRSRNHVQQEEWVRGLQARILAEVQGERSVKEVGERSLSVLVEAADAVVGAIYTSDGTLLRLSATHGVRAGTDLPETFALGEGIGGAAAAAKRIAVLTDVPPASFPLRSAFVNSTPSHLAVIPLVADDTPEGVIELGLKQAPPQLLISAFERMQYSLAVAIRTAVYRARVRALLTETQHQAEHLRTQQEELRAANEELEEQSDALRASQARLEEQQAELEATNAQLESQAEILEQQQERLVVARQEAERSSRYKSEFLANMSHELRTPLNSTLILAKLLAQNKDGRLSDEQVRFAETIHASGTSLLALINDILDLSKIEAGAIGVQIETVRVDAFVETLDRTFRPLLIEKGLEFTIDVAPLVPPEIVTDGQRLLQILTNLLSNAHKFTERGGVVVRIRPEPQGLVAFEVRDTGPGIPPAQHAVIFEAFRQADGSTHRRHGGTGLGLSISQQLAHLLGGNIHLQSTQGMGSTFTLTIPVRHERPAGVQEQRVETARVPPPIPPGSAFPDDRVMRRHPGRLILVVEDDPAFARILYDSAHALDFDCVVATTNDEGMALARQMSPNAILLDVRLPDGSGLTLLDRLKRNPDTRHIPVHMVSVTDHAHMALALGAVGYATKPVQQDVLLKAIGLLEARLEQRAQRVLLVEDDSVLRESLMQLLQIDGVTIHPAATAREALDELAATSFDCVILDLYLPDASGFEVLETMSTDDRYSFPPVIVHTGRPLSPADEERLRQYSRSVIVKGARSPERLLAEVTLFLHQVESRLPPDAQRLLRVARERDEFFEGRTILIAEDDIRNVFALTSVFEPLGAAVVVARNGREAIDALDRGRPDLVLMDVMMPEMDGLTAMRAMRTRPELRTMPIIALTAKAMPDDYQQCLAAGANDYLSKPLDVDKLVSLCRVWMSR